MKLGNVFILGDSYSTFRGLIPQGYATYYGSDLHPESGVLDVSQTWWQRLIDKTDGKLILNSSWSGTTICNTGYNGDDCSDRSFIARLDKLIENGFFKENCIDTFILFGGTNDNWAGSPIGKVMYSDWQPQDLYSVFPALCYLLDRVKTNLPQTRIIAVLNTELKSEIVSGFNTVCGKYGVDLIELCDIEKVGGHPTAKGMENICEQILKAL